MLEHVDENVRELEAVWQDAAKGRDKSAKDEPNGPRGTFFAAHLDEVLRRASEGSEIWHVRMQSFVDDTKGWRHRLRGGDIWRSNSTVLLRSITALRIWDNISSPAERESLEGLWARTYLLEFSAATEGGREAAKLCMKAAELADVNPLPPEHSDPYMALSLRRRRLTLLATAKRLSTFMDLRRRPQNWEALAEAFGEAADLSEEAQRLVPIAKDKGADLHRMWESLMRLRANQERGNVAEARIELSSALTGAKKIENPLTIGGRWRSIKEIAAERHLIDCIEELNKGDSADPAMVQEHLKRWCVNTDRADPPPSPRRSRLMKLRWEAAVAANRVRTGHDITLATSAMRRIANEDRYLEANFANVLAACARARPQASSAAVNILAALADNIRQIDGDALPLPPHRVTAQMSPSWLRSAGDEPEATAYIALLRYLRVIVEYLWCVYRDRARELNIEIPRADPRSFRDLTIDEAAQALAALRKALAWRQLNLSTRALDQVCGLLESHPLVSGHKLVNRPPDINTGDLLDAVVNSTLTDLFPLVVRATGDPPQSFPTDIPVLRLDRREELSTVYNVKDPPPSWPCFGLKPLYKRRDALTQTLRLRHQKPLHLYSTFTWPTPSLVRVLVEGESDAAAFTAYMDHMVPYWRGLPIRIADCGGDSLPGRLLNIEMKRPADDPERACSLVIMADADKKPGTGSWQDVWRQPHAFAVEPDLERLDWSALAEALVVAHGAQLDIPDLREIESRFIHNKENKVPYRAKTFVAQLERELDLRDEIKNREFGAELGKRLALYENPLLAKICRCVVELSEGWKPNGSGRSR